MGLTDRPLGTPMRTPVTDAKGQLRDPVPDRRSRRALLEAVGAAGRANANAGPTAASSQDFLYGDDGLLK